MVLRRKRQCRTGTLGIGGLLTFETRLTDDVFGIPGPVVCRTCARPGRNAGSAAVADLRPISCLKAEISFQII
jgi:hypothetical protein